MNTNKPSFILLLMYITFGSVNAVLFTPALPEIAQYFDINCNLAGLTITVFLIGYAIGPLLYGPLANRYGRKIALYIGISIEIFAALLCVLSAAWHWIQLLLIARFLMALGASVGLKMTFTLVADTYEQAHARKIVGYLLIGGAITPSIGVTIGGLLTEYLNWQSCFYFMMIYGLIVLAMTYRLPETAKSLDLHALKIGMIVKKYTILMSNLRLMSGGVLMGCGTTIVYVFSALAPFIAMQEMHLNPVAYSIWNLLPPVGLLVGSQISIWLIKKCSAIQTILLGVLMIVFGLMLMMGLFITHHFTAVDLFLPMVIINLGTAFIYANASTLAISHLTDKANASAMMSFINMSSATVIVLVVGFITSTSHLLLPIIVAVISVLALFATLSLASTMRQS